MKKLIWCAAAVAAMAMAGGASAQSADCARGMLGSDPCGASGVVVPNPNYTNDRDQRDWAYRNSTRWNQPNAYPYHNWEGPRNNRDRRDAREDRDRDGVANSRDRHPDDRRRR